MIQLRQNKMIQLRQNKMIQLRQNTMLQLRQIQRFPFHCANTTFMLPKVALKVA